MDFTGAFNTSYQQPSQNIIESKLYDFNPLQPNYHERLEMAKKCFLDSLHQYGLEKNKLPEIDKNLDLIIEYALENSSPKN